MNKLKLLVNITVIITMVGAFKNVFGEDLSISSGPWCWIRGCLKNMEIVKWMTITGKGWEIATYIVTAFLYIYLKYYMIKRVNLKLAIWKVNLRQWKHLIILKLNALTLSWFYMLNTLFIWDKWERWLHLWLDKYLFFQNWREKLTYFGNQ